MQVGFSTELSGRNEKLSVNVLVSVKLVQFSTSHHFMLCLENDGRICLKESVECSNKTLLYAFIKFLLRSLKCLNSKIKLSW